MIFQEPMTSLNPVFTIGMQMMEVVLAHERVSRKRGVRAIASPCSSWSAFPTPRRA